MLKKYIFTKKSRSRYREVALSRSSYVARSRYREVALSRLYKTPSILHISANGVPVCLIKRNGAAHVIRKPKIKKTKRRLGKVAFAVYRFRECCGYRVKNK